MDHVAIACQYAGLAAGISSQVNATRLQSSLYSITNITYIIGKYVPNPGSSLIYGYDNLAVRVFVF